MTRHVVTWCLLRLRTWVALVAAFVGTLLASGDRQPGWTLMVAASMSLLAVLSIRAHFLDEHPDWPDREQRRQIRLDAWAEEVLRRQRGRPAPRRVVKAATWERPLPPRRDPRVRTFEPAAEGAVTPVPGPPRRPAPEAVPETVPEAVPQPRRLSKQEAEVAAIVRRYEEQVAARRAALKPPPSPE